MAKRLPNNKFILAAKDLNGTLSELEKGLLHMPGKTEDYKSLFNSVSFTLNDIKGLGGFIRKVGLNKSECKMYWESLIMDGFTLYVIESGMSDFQISELCDGKKIRFLTAARK